MHNDLPPYVHRKMAKGKAYYYFAADGAKAGQGPRYIRLPDITDPTFGLRVGRLIEALPSGRRERWQASTGARPMCMVYFLGADEGPIKIGSSRDPDTRRRGLLTGSPHDVRILATTPGGSRLEKAYHQRFEYAKVRREWYDRVPELMAEITRLQRENKTEK